MMQEKNSDLVKNILLTLADTYKVKGLKELALYLEIPATQIYGWIRNGKIVDTGVILAKSPNINREWLRTGKGDRFVTTTHHGNTTISKSNNVIAGEVKNNTNTHITQTYTEKTIASQSSGRSWKLSAKEERFIIAIRKIGENPFVDELLERAEAAARALSW